MNILKNNCKFYFLLLFSRKESSTRQKELHDQHEILLQDNKKFDKKSDAILSAINSTQTRLNELFVFFSLFSFIYVG